MRIFKKNQPKPNPEAVRQQSEQFERSFGTAVTALAYFVDDAPLIRCSVTQKPWLVGIERVLDADDPVTHELFTDPTALSLFFRGLSAEAVRQLVEIGHDTEIARAALEDVSSLVMDAMNDIREKHLTPIGRERRYRVVRMLSETDTFSDADVNT